LHCFGMGRGGLSSPPTPHHPTLLDPPMDSATGNWPAFLQKLRRISDESQRSSCHPQKVFSSDFMIELASAGGVRSRFEIEIRSWRPVSGVLVGRGFVGDAVAHLSRSRVGSNFGHEFHRLKGQATFSDRIRAGSRQAEPRGRLIRARPSRLHNLILIALYLL